MEIRAYDEIYLTDAQNILGHAVDFAVMSLELDPDLFGNAFAVSNSSKQFANGNPRYVAGMNGCELARQILTETQIPFSDTEDAMFLDKSPEYWAGWALAYYQWYSNRSFMTILQAVPLTEILQMYPIFHEMDITHFTDRMDEKLKQKNPMTQLKIRRDACGLSQAALAADADVPLRQIQLFEQRQRDINKTAALTLLRLSRALHCHMEDLIEYDSL
jgi:DNA-binding transcriptional regulator YiaG